MKEIFYALLCFVIVAGCLTPQPEQTQTPEGNIYTGAEEFSIPLKEHRTSGGYYSPELNITCIYLRIDYGGGLSCLPGDLRPKENSSGAIAIHPEMVSGMGYPVPPTAPSIRKYNYTTGTKQVCNISENQSITLTAPVGSGFSQFAFTNELGEIYFCDFVGNTITTEVDVPFCEVGILTLDSAEGTTKCVVE